MRLFLGCHIHNAMYAEFYSMDYSEFKTIILVFLLRFADMHPDNFGRKERGQQHLSALWEAEVREENDTRKDTTILAEEYKQLWLYEMNDLNRASSAAQGLVNSHFLQRQPATKAPEQPATQAQLVILSLKRKKGSTRFLVETMTTTIQNMLKEEKSRVACFYPIVSINNDHYINLCTRSGPTSWDQVDPSTGVMCRPPTRKGQRERATKEKIVDSGSDHRQGKKQKVKELQFMMYDGKNHFGKLGRRSKVIELNKAWVNFVWDKKEQREWRSKKGNFVELSMGHSLAVAEPPHLFPDKPIRHPQCGRTCLASSFASVLHMAGHEQSGMNLQQKIETFEQGSENLVNNFVNEVNKSKARDRTGRKLKMQLCKNYDILHGPTPVQYTRIDVTLSSVSYLAIPCRMRIHGVCRLRD